MELSTKPKNSASGTQATAVGHSSRLLVVLVIALFFIWGGITSLNDILIPKLKSLFQLSYTQAMLTQFAFFTAYAVVSLPAGFLVARLGYGRGIVLGLAIMAIGCLAFVPAAFMASYGLFLGALFVLAGGITVLQVAANPLIARLGPAETSHSRLTFAQAFNSLGTAIWPFLGAQVILGSVVLTDPATLSGEALVAFQAQEAEVLSNTYMGIAVVLFAIAALFWFRRNLLGQAQAATAVSGSFALLRQPRLAFGVTSIFVYVGAEVTIGSIMVNYLVQSSTMGLDERSAGELIALYWSGAMVGRFVGAGLMRLVSPARLLALAAVGAASLVLASALASGPLAGWLLISVGLMNAIMFPTIFSLSLEGLGDDAPQASGLLCMAIVGGAIVPLVTGALADGIGLAGALAAPAICYFVVAGFGWFCRRPAAPLKG